MVEFKRNPKTGELEAFKEGKKVGQIFTMGDGVRKKEMPKPTPKPRSKNK